MDLAETGLACDDSPDRRLNGRLLILQVFDLFYEDVAVLLRGQAIDAVQKNCAVVVGDQISLPSLEQLLFEMVHDVCRDQVVLGLRELLLRRSLLAQGRGGFYRSGAPGLRSAGLSERPFLGVSPPVHGNLAGGPDVRVHFGFLCLQICARGRQELLLGVRFVLWLASAQSACSELHSASFALLRSVRILSPAALLQIDVDWLSVGLDVVGRLRWLADCELLLVSEGVHIFK